VLYKLNVRLMQNTDERVRTDVYPIHTGALKVEVPKKEKPKKTKAQIKKRGRKRKFVWT